MSERSRTMNRRDAIRGLIGAGAGLALGGTSLWADSGDLAAGMYTAQLLTKPIPSTGEQLPIIGIGTARRYDVATSEAEMAPLREVIRRLPEIGGTLVDTAPSYGAAEDVLGNLIGEVGNRDRLFLATKVGRGREGRAQGIAEIERSKQRLRTDRFDLLQVHNLGGVGDMLPVLREMKQAGQIRYLGVTTTSRQQYGEVERLLRTEPMDFLQIDYAIDNRGVEERILPLAQDQGVAVLTALPFGRGRVFEAFGDQPVPEWAAELGIQSWAQFALKYIVSHPAVTAAIPGTARPEYLVDNLGTAGGSLPDEATRRRMAQLIDDA
jgi:aryl-alcohol dehydrogenase-like predicted oxidoreductase